MAQFLVEKTPDFLNMARHLAALSRYEVHVGLFSEVVSEDLLVGAWVSEFGARIPKTQKMRRFLGAMASKYGIRLDPAKGDPQFVVVPCRSFVRAAVDENQGNIMEVAAMAVSSYTGSWATAELTTPQQVYAAIGAKLEQVIKHKIRSITSPPLHPLTAAMGRKEKPFGRGQLMRAVRFRVVPRGTGG